MSPDGPEAGEAVGAGPLRPDSVDVWLVDVDAPAFLARADSDLPTVEDRARADRLTVPEAATRLLARRATLRLILARYIEADPATLRIVTAPGGKPVLVPGPAFSVAHSGSLYAVAVSGASSVGVDVERLRTVPRAAAIAERWFGPEEARSLSEVDAAELDLAFLRLWTAKEALAKRHGAGLRLMKGRGERSGGALDVAAGRSEGRLLAFDPGEGYLGTVASTVPIERVRIVPTEESWTI